jgi:3-oxoacyl-ACP reductase-like protein
MGDTFLRWFPAIASADSNALKHSKGKRDPAMSAEKRVAIVTGASHGIGAALMHAYRQEGYSVVATARMVKQTDDTDIPRVLGDIA